MRALIVGPDERAAIGRLVEYAKEPGHHYIPGRTKVVPGDDPAFVVQVPDGFRCVFTITKHNGQLFRHLTVSVPTEKYPSPEACVMLAKEFGFTTKQPETNFDLISRMEDGWMVSMGHEGEHCIVLAQPVEGQGTA